MREMGPAEAALLPPPAPPEAFSLTPWLSLLLLLPAAFLLFKAYQNSRRGRLRRLRRELLRGSVMPRRAAHTLALLLREVSLDKNALPRALDKIRFRREEPSREQVLDLIREAEVFLGAREKRISSAASLPAKNKTAL